MANSPLSEFINQALICVPSMFQIHIDTNSVNPHQYLPCNSYDCSLLQTRTPSHRGLNSVFPSYLTLRVAAPDSNPDNVALHLCSEHTPRLFTVVRSEGSPYLDIACWTQDFPGK